MKNEHTHGECLKCVIVVCANAKRSAFGIVKMKYRILAENNRDRIGECLDKDYDEQEVDDEIDEESDAAAETHVMQEQSAAKKDTLLRAQQRLRAINQQDPHRIRYSQPPSQLCQTHPLATRFVAQNIFSA